MTSVAICYTEIADNDRGDEHIFILCVNIVKLDRISDTKIRKGLIA